MNYSRQKLSWHLRFRSSVQFIVASVTVAVFTDTFLYSLLIPIFPSSIHERCGVPREKVQWYTALIVGMSGTGNVIGSFMFGWLADHSKNRRTPLLLGLLLFIFATVMIWVGRVISLIAIGRFLQGLASACVWSVGLALLVDTVSKNEVPISMGYINIGFCSGTVVGPIVGGMMYSYAGYDVTMAAAVGLLILDVVLRLLIVEKRELALIMADRSDEASNFPNDEVSPLLGNGHGPHAGGSNNSAEEIAYLTLIRSSKVAISLACAAIQAISMSAFEVTLPLRLGAIFDYGPRGASLAFIPLMVPAFLAPVIGYFCDRIGNQPIVASGYLICGIMFILLRLPKSHTVLDQVAMFGDLSFIGIAMCMIMTPVLTEIFIAVDDLENQKPGRFGPYGAFAQAYGLFQLFYSAGMLIGPLIAGWLKTSFSWDTMTLALGIFNVLAISLMVPADQFRAIRRRFVRFTTWIRNLHKSHESGA